MAGAASGQAAPADVPRARAAANEPQYCCDYVYVTRDLAPRLRAMRVDAMTQASDHQPVVVELA